MKKEQTFRYIDIQNRPKRKEDNMVIQKERDNISLIRKGEYILASKLIN